MKMHNLSYVAILVCSIALAGCGRYPTNQMRMDQAAASLRAGDYRQAISELQNVLNRDAHHTAALIAIARAELRLGDAAAARSYFRRAKDAGGNAPELEALNNELLLAEAMYGELLKHLDAMPPDAATLILRAKAEIASNDLQSAETTLARAADAHVDESQVLVLRARLLLADQKRAEALDAATKAADESGNLAEAWLLKARLLRAQGAQKEALAAFEHAASIPAGDLTAVEQVRTYAGLIELRLQGGDLAGAKAVLDTLKRRYSGTEPARYYEGRVAMQSGEAQSAVNEFRILSNARPDDAAIKTLLGTALLAQGSTEQAIATLNEALAKNPADKDGRKLLARAQLADNRADEARRTLAPIAKESAAEPEADWLLGLSLLNAGNAAGSIAHLQRATAALPDEVAVQAHLARAYVASGDYARARAALDRIPTGNRDASVRQLQIMANMAGHK